MGGVTNGLDPDFPRICLRRLGLPVRALAKLPAVFVIAICSISRCICFSSRGPPPKKRAACRCLVVQGRPTQRKTGYPANAWSKDYMADRREKVAKRQLVRREGSAHDAENGWRKQNGLKSRAWPNDPHPAKAGSAVTRRRLRAQLVANRELRNKSGRSPPSVRVKFRHSPTEHGVAGRSATRNISKHSGFAVSRDIVWGYILRSAHHKSPRSKPPKDATYD